MSIWTGTRWLSFKPCGSFPSFSPKSFCNFQWGSSVRESFVMLSHCMSILSSTVLWQKHKTSAPGVFYDQLWSYFLFLSFFLPLFNGGQSCIGSGLRSLWHFFLYSLTSSSQNTEAVCPSKILIRVYQTSWGHVPEDYNLSAFTAVTVSEFIQP